MISNLNIFIYLDICIYVLCNIFFIMSSSVRFYAQCVLLYFLRFLSSFVTFPSSLSSSSHLLLVVLIDSPSRAHRAFALVVQPPWSSVSTRSLHVSYFGLFDSWLCPTQCLIFTSEVCCSESLSSLCIKSVMTCQSPIRYTETRFNTFYFYCCS